jgi:HAD superfamily hydrolase (TIGR01484 family)
MLLTPLTSTLATELKSVRLVATDMDGTLTQGGKFTAELLQTLEVLANSEIPVLIVTGRSAGWVSGLRSYLPVVGAIAENGGLYYGDTETPDILTPISDIANHRIKLQATFNQLKADFPKLQESADNAFRLTDWTFDVSNLTIQDKYTLAKLCQAQGWGFTYSTVQCHIKPLTQDKASSLEKVLQTHFPHLKRKQILTVGDSPNDESLFNPNKFPLSVGVANILDYTEQLSHHPRYVTTEAESKGFGELAQVLLTDN